MKLYTFLNIERVWMYKMQANYTMQQLYFFIERQQKEITSLRNSIQSLSNELKQLKEKPTVTVERLEYKFDQLKVETLEGTLNIGMNPADLNSVEDFSAPPGSTQTQAFVRHPNLYDEILEKLNHYIDNELDTLIKDTETQVGRNLEEPYINMIKEDIRKQIPGRADHYLGFFSSQHTHDVNEEELYSKVYKTLLADINKAVHGFISQIPNQQGGMNPHGT
ncbi:putative spore germination protein GerPC [Siminovitchia terrae]|uniref:spore germination protein GerPC n=1 Tax=Siminovitchia terrae TaxID=1914933 RepID=UPI001B238A74|nr:spore germination protein GerPC [Siminovitchia terrae]GIN89943.1 putative spore germination protein GerPC [Siminovitchia terrae]